MLVEKVLGVYLILYFTDQGYFDREISHEFEKVFYHVKKMNSYN